MRAGVRLVALLALGLCGQSHAALALDQSNLTAMRDLIGPSNPDPVTGDRQFAQRYTGKPFSARLRFVKFYDNNIDYDGTVWLGFDEDGKLWGDPVCETKDKQLIEQARSFAVGDMIQIAATVGKPELGTIVLQRCRLTR